MKQTESFSLFEKSAFEFRVRMFGLKCGDVTLFLDLILQTWNISIILLCSDHRWSVENKKERNGGGKGMHTQRR